MRKHGELDDHGPLHAHGQRHTQLHADGSIAARFCRQPPARGDVDELLGNLDASRWTRRGHLLCLRTVRRATIQVRGDGAREVDPKPA
jgi:hypothetical protein